MWWSFVSYVVVLCLWLALRQRAEYYVVRRAKFRVIHSSIHLFLDERLEQGQKLRARTSRSTFRNTAAHYCWYVLVKGIPRGNWNSLPLRLLTCRLYLNTSWLDSSFLSAKQLSASHNSPADCGPNCKPGSHFAPQSRHG
ncbi:hypothetical protein DFH06DRAFT_185516 [Mycena polygramma]|nr:hypothetical protein DFH06DRAFT_185516 [Mycena polygramma]